MKDFGFRMSDFGLSWRRLEVSPAERLFRNPKSDIRNPLS